MNLKLIGWIAAIVAAVGVTWGAIAMIGDAIENIHDGKAAKQCELGARTQSGAIDACSGAVKTLVQEARQARECDAALAVYRAAAPTSAALGQSGFTIKMSCSEPVKTLVARADADAANLADTKAQLAIAAQTTADAVKRAEARSLNTANRKAADDAVISAQPRTADGNVTCDADCLRRLSDAP
jgi:hypothetical protein